MCSRAVPSLFVVPEVFPGFLLTDFVVTENVSRALADVLVLAEKFIGHLVGNFGSR